MYLKNCLKIWMKSNFESASFLKMLLETVDKICIHGAGKFIFLNARKNVNISSHVYCFIKNRRRVETDAILKEYLHNIRMEDINEDGFVIDKDKGCYEKVWN